MTVLAGLPAKVRALSARERALLLLGAASIVLFVLVKGVAFPAAAEYRRNRAGISDRRTVLARSNRVALGIEDAEGLLVEAAERLEELEGGLLPGDNPPAAGVFLQGLLRPMVERPDTRLMSLRGLAPGSRGAYAEVSVQMDLQTTTEGLAAILSAVPRSATFLHVRKLTVGSGYYGPAMAGRRETLTVSIVVAGLARSAVEEKPEIRTQEAVP